MLDFATITFCKIEARDDQGIGQKAGQIDHFIKNKKVRYYENARPFHRNREQIPQKGI